MRPRTSWFLALTCLLAASSGIAQSFSVSGRSDSTSYTFSFTLQTAMPAMSVMTGAPYSGRRVSSSVRMLVDGTRLTSSSRTETTTYRDSAGRMREERALFQPARSGAEPRLLFTIVEISDPLGGYSYLLDPVNRVAHRVPLKFQPAPPPMPSRPPVSRPPPPAQASPNGPITQVEQLGLRTIGGVTAQGSRATTLHPAGSIMGNDRPMTTVRETWIHPETRVMLLSKTTGPEAESVTTMEGFSTAEPDPKLFQVPPDYAIADVTGPVKIVLPREN